MMRSDVFISSIFFIFAIVMAFQSIKIGIGNFEMPGPGLFPFLSICVFGILSLVSLISGLFRKGGKAVFGFKLGKYWTRSLGSMLVTFVYVTIFWEKLGYIIATTLWLILLFWITGTRSIKKIIIITIIAVILSYFAFNDLLRCLLPKGIFGV